MKNQGFKAILRKYVDLLLNLLKLILKGLYLYIKFIYFYLPIKLYELIKKQYREALKREEEEFQKVLTKDEKIEALIEGDLKLFAFKKGKLRESSYHGRLVATNKRVFFYTRSFWGNKGIIEFPYNKISAIAYDNNALVISTGGDKILVENIKKGEPQFFIEKVRNIMQNFL